MIKNNFKNILIKSFRDSFSTFSKTENFLFLGRTLPWEQDNTPPLANDSYQEELEAWKNMIFCKKLAPNEVAFGVKKIVWEYGTVYSQYDDIENLSQDDPLYNFYVMTEQKNVYKCISNNNNSISIFPPTGIANTDTIITSDGYIWKFMYTISEDLQKFITNDFIPVDFLDTNIFDPLDVRNDQLVVQIDAKNKHGGEISNILITQTGGQYPFAVDYDESVIIDVPEFAHKVQYSSFTAGTANQSIIRLNTRLPDIDRTNTIYPNNYCIYMCDGICGGQVRNIVEYNGATGEIVTDTKFSAQDLRGDSYKILPRIEITGNGIGASAIPIFNLNTRRIKAIKILNRGVYYTECSAEILKTGSKVEESTKLRVIKSPVLGHGHLAFDELQCRHLIISVKLNKTNADSMLEFLNDFRQIGIVQDVQLQSGKTYSPQYSLEIESFDSSQDINFSYSSLSSGHPFSNPNNLSQKVFKQGTGANQAIGIFKSFNTTTKILSLLPVQNRFSSYSSSTFPIVVEDYPGIGNTYVLNDVAATAVTINNFFDDNTFKTGEYIIGSQTNTTAQILSWEPNKNLVMGELIVDNVKGLFSQSYFDGFGVLKSGEIITSFYSDKTDPRVIISNGASKSGVINKLLPRKIQNDDAADTVYRATVLLVIKRPAGSTVPFTSTSFSRDLNIIQKNSSGRNIASGTVIDWAINTNDGTNTTGLLIVSMIYGVFTTSLVDNLWKLENSIETFIEQSIVCDVQASEVVRYSGKMIYIENIKPIAHGTDSKLQVKLIIGMG